MPTADHIVQYDQLKMISTDQYSRTAPKNRQTDEKTNLNYINQQTL